MRPAEVACDSDTLRRLVDGRLTGADEETWTRHLDHCPRCQREVETLAAEPQLWGDAIEALSKDDGLVAPAATMGEEDEPTPLSLSFLAPSDDPNSLGRIGPYEITGVIGHGGTGVVLKAFDAALHRNVAVKVLAPHLAASGAARKRFSREAKAVAAVAHEHIVPIYAVDEARDLPYLVMRYVPGRSLAERLQKQGPLDTSEILRIGLQTARGLAAAHAQGIVHRDVKPGNILLEHGVERVLLTDFGLARTVDDASLTCSGVLAGTPQYMAPEQARGEGVDGRSDLFALGSVLYACATGHSPFRAETTMGVLHRICNETHRPLRQINPAIPKRVAEAIDRLLAKSPDRRPTTANEAATLFEDLLAEWQRPDGPDRMRDRPPLVQMRRVLALTALGLALTLVATLFAALNDPQMRGLFATWIEQAQAKLWPAAAPATFTTVIAQPPSPQPPARASAMSGYAMPGAGQPSGAMMGLSADGTLDDSADPGFVEEDFSLEAVERSLESESLPGEALYELAEEERAWRRDVDQLKSILNQRGIE